jgi:galactokinase
MAQAIQTRPLGIAPKAAPLGQKSLVAGKHRRSAILEKRQADTYREGSLESMAVKKDADDALKLFVPGRICLFGEHSDWAGGHRRTNPDLEKGYTLITGTDQGIHATVRPHDSDLVLTATAPNGTRYGPHVMAMEPDTLLSTAQQGGFWSYIAGVAYQVQSRYHVGGLVIDNYLTDLPIRKGLSSSAAISVLTTRAYNCLYGLGLSIRDEMELAYLGEVTTPSRCGRMDQGCAFGSCPVLMIFDGEELHTKELRVGRDVHLVIVDLRAKKDTHRILSQLNLCYPKATSGVAQDLQRLLGPTNRQIVAKAVEALETGSVQRLGALMREAQAAFDRYAVPACPDELVAPVLHRVLRHRSIQDHIWGGKGVGSQGDGSAQFVARSAADQEAVIRILEGELGMPCLSVSIQANDQPGGCTTI